MGTTATAQDAATDARTAPRRRLENSRGEMAHLVCCRAQTWDVAWCGEPIGHLNLAVEVVCTMCAEVAEQHLPGWLENGPVVCPLDRRPCPDEHELDLRILREVSPR